MVVPMFLLKLSAQWLFSLNKATKKLKTKALNFLHKNPSRPSSSSHLTPSSLTNFWLQEKKSQTIVSNFYGTILKPTQSHFFPYFMLVAFEGGSLIRALLLLLLSSPFLWAIGYQNELSVKIMTFITFCGLRARNVELIGKAVMPKFFFENLNVEACEALGFVDKRVVFCGSLPRVMVEGFLKEYLGIGEVLGVELQIVKGGYFSGFVCGSWLDSKQNKLKDLFGETKADVGLVSSYGSSDHLSFISYCKEIYIVSKETNMITTTPSQKPKTNYPKPLIFHDSRLAILPTPLSTLSLFIFLPFSIPLAVGRAALALLLPYKLMFPLSALAGARFRVRNHEKFIRPTDTDKTLKQKGTLYVCTHRTLLDPVMLATALQRPVPAVTYSLSLLSEALAPMRTVRLARNRDSDSDTISRLLKEGDLTVCPEGTTCREPYLLRFSPLFAEIADEIVPVAMDAQVSWFYGTTASGFKWLDPLFFVMNPIMSYRVEFLDRVEKETSCEGGWSGSDVANRIQKRLGDALGFECTRLTRRDKYMMLAGNDGLVKKDSK